MYRPKHNFMSFNYSDLYRNPSELSPTELNRSFNIEVQVICPCITDLSDYRTLRDMFKTFFNNYDIEDIVEVVESLNILFDSVPQERIKITIKNKTNNSIQSVEYENSLLKSYHFSNSNWDDIFSISENQNVVDIRFKKDHCSIQTKEDVGIIYDKLNSVFEKIVKLRKLGNNRLKYSENKKSSL